MTQFASETKSFMIYFDVVKLQVSLNAALNSIAPLDGFSLVNDIAEIIPNDVVESKFVKEVCHHDCARAFSSFRASMGSVEQNIHDCYKD